MSYRPLWTCPRCGRTFANVNQTHTFRKVEVYSARNVLHAFRLTSPAEVDDAFAALVAEAYAVGRQEYLPH